MPRAECRWRPSLTPGLGYCPGDHQFSLPEVFSSSGTDILLGLFLRQEENPGSRWPQDIAPSPAAHFQTSRTLCLGGSTSITWRPGWSAVGVHSRSRKLESSQPEMREKAVPPTKTWNSGQRLWVVWVMVEKAAAVSVCCDLFAFCHFSHSLWYLYIEVL